MLIGIYSTPKIVVSALDVKKSMQNSGIFGAVTEVAVENTSLWDVDDI
jgi:hypothetical protein